MLLSGLLNMTDNDMDFIITLHFSAMIDSIGDNFLGTWNIKPVSART